MKKVRYIIVMAGMMVLEMGWLMAQNVIGAMGGDVKTVGGRVSYTLGQSADGSFYDTVVTVNSREAMMTEGVQQPYLSWEVLDIEGVVEMEVEVEIYPNPTIRGFRIDISDKEGVYRYELYSVNGMVLESGELKGGSRKIDMDGYAAGSYMLRVSTWDDKQERNFKIIKSH